MSKEGVSKRTKRTKRPDTSKVPYNVLNELNGQSALDTSKAYETGRMNYNGWSEPKRTW